MTRFFGQETSKVDANGRLKLNKRFEEDFRALGTRKIVLHCLPEGGLAVYPLEAWERMRSEDLQEYAMNAGRSILARRQLRRLNCLTHVEELSNNFRLTIPPEFRPVVQLHGGTEAVLVGCGIWIEVWNAERWAGEFGAVREHDEKRAEAEIRADLSRLETGIETEKGKAE